MKPKPSESVQSYRDVVYFTGAHQAYGSYNDGDGALYLLSHYMGADCLSKSGTGKGTEGEGDAWQHFVESGGSHAWIFFSYMN